MGGDTVDAAITVVGRFQATPCPPWDGYSRTGPGDTHGRARRTAKGRANDSCGVFCIKKKCHSKSNKPKDHFRRRRQNSDKQEGSRRLREVPPDLGVINTKLEKGAL